MTKNAFNASHKCRIILEDAISSCRQYKSFLTLLSIRRDESCFNCLPTNPTKEQFEMIVEELIRFLYIKSRHTNLALVPSVDLDEALLALLSMPRLYREFSDLIVSQLYDEHITDTDKVRSSKCPLPLIDNDPFIEFNTHSWWIRLLDTCALYKKYFPDGAIFPDLWRADYEEDPNEKNVNSSSIPGDSGSCGSGSASASASDSGSSSDRSSDSDRSSGSDRSSVSVIEAYGTSCRALCSDLQHPVSFMGERSLSPGYHSEEANHSFGKRGMKRKLFDEYDEES